MNAPEVRIVMPAYNEALRIAPCLEDYCTYFGPRAAIVVVANGCHDETVDVVRRFAQRFANLTVIDIAAKVGKGGAVRAGLMTGDEPYVGFVDADHSFAAAEYDKILQALQKAGADGAIASRALPGARVDPPATLRRRVASRVFNALVRLCLGLPYGDTQCGAKIFRRDLVRRLFANLRLANLAFDIDLLYSAHKVGARIVEVPITLVDVAGSSIKLVSASVRMFAALMRLRLEHSPISQVPYLEFLAADAVIPMHKTASVLLLADDEDLARDERARAMLHRAAAAGITVARPPRARGSRWLRRLALFGWYVRSSHRRYDAIVEIASSVPHLLGIVSIKPSFVVGDRAPSRVARALYARYRRLVHFAAPDATFDAALANVTYRVAAFEQMPTGWVLHLAPTSLGGERRTIDLE